MSQSRPEQVRQQGDGLLRSQGGKARSNRFDLGNFWNLKIVSAFRIDTGRAFHKAGPDIERLLTQSYFAYEEQTDRQIFY